MEGCEPLISGHCCFAFGNLQWRLVVSSPDLVGVLQNLYNKKLPQQVWGWLQRACCWLDDFLPVIFRKLWYSYAILRSRMILIGWLKSYDTISCFMRKLSYHQNPNWKSVQNLTNQQQASLLQWWTKTSKASSAILANTYTVQAVNDWPLKHQLLVGQNVLVTLMILTAPHDRDWNV